MTSNHAIPGRADALADDTTFDESGFVLDDDASFDGDQLDREERAALRRVGGLSTEMIERLDGARPDTLAAAGRIRGITPAALAAILVHVRRKAA